MADFDELKLDKSAAPAPPPQPRWILIVAIVALLVAALALWFYWRASPDIAETASGSNPVTARSLDQAPAAPVDLPPLDATDALVRELIGTLSQHPTVASLLTSDQLIRTFAVSVKNIVDGDTPSPHLQTIQPGTQLKVRRQGNRTYIDPASYARFDRHAAAIDSIDPAGGARVYRTLKPRLEEAYREVAGPTADFDRAFAQAVARLLQTPIVDQPIEVKPATVGYTYADPALESLPRAQQQMVRMGPGNTRILQEKLRAIARELGISVQ